MQITDRVQEVVIAGGLVCFWVGPDRTSATLFSLRLYGAVYEASNNGAAVAFLLAAHASAKRVTVTTENNQVTKLQGADHLRVTIEISSVADSYPYAQRVHDHDGRYSLLGHDHDHNALQNRLPMEHTLAIRTTLRRPVPFGTPLQELLLSYPEFVALKKELERPLATVPPPTPTELRDAYVARNGMTTIEAYLTDAGGAVAGPLIATLSHNAAAADLRWGLRIYRSSTEAEYTRPTQQSTEDVNLIITTHLNAP